MLNQNNSIRHSLVSLNDNIVYIVALDLLGEVICQHSRNTPLENNAIDKIASKFRKITTATSLLNFDNIKFLMYEEDNLKHVIINLEEMSIIVGFSTIATLSDVLYILDEFMKAQVTC